jgi:hypothetical protein
MCRTKRVSFRRCPVPIKTGEVATRFSKEMNCSRRRSTKTKEYSAVRLHMEGRLRRRRLA